MRKRTFAAVGRPPGLVILVGLMLLALPLMPSGLKTVSAGVDQALLVAASGDVQVYLPAIHKGWAPPAPGEALLISEVVYDPQGSEPEGEWLELYNAGTHTIDLSQYKIGDEETRGGGEGMLRFPAGASIAPGQVVLVASRAREFSNQYGFSPDYEMGESDLAVPTLVKYTAWAGGSVVLLNSSDEVVLVNEQDQVVDAVSWGSSTFAFDPPAPDVREGHSLERVPAYQDRDAADDWADQPVPRPGVVNLIPPTPTPAPTGTPTPTPTETFTPTPGPSPSPTLSPTPFGGLFLISEVLYDPVGPEPAGEWIELYNPGGQAIPLGFFKIGDEETPGGGEGMLRFPDAATLGAGQVIVVAHEASAFHAAYGFDPDYEMVDSNPLVPDMQPYTMWAGGSLSLGNTGDEVLLLDGADQAVDALSWGSSVFAFDPPAPDVAQGHSLERVPANGDTDSATDWLDQSQPAPGQVDLMSPTSTPTLTPTPTLLPSATPTAWPSPTRTPGVTPGPSPTASPPSPTPTSMATPTPTPSASPTAVGSLTATATPTSGATPTSTASVTPGPAGHLLISEVFYDAPGSDAQEEWVELYNPDATAVDLTGYKLGDEETQGGGEGMFQFPAGAMIAPGEKLVVALQANGFRALYGFAPDFEISDSDPAVPDMVPYPVWGGGAMALSNAGDEILLLDGGDFPVDVVTYEGGSYPGVVPHPGVGTGHSIERWPPGQDTDDCSLDFIDRLPPTPGA